MEIERTYDKELAIAYVHKISEFFMPPLTKKINISEFVDKVLRYGYLYLVKDQTNTICGVLSFYANNQENLTAFISLLGLDEHCRGKGVGTKLLSLSEEISRKAGMRQIMLETWEENKSAQNFYEKWGFTIAKRYIDAFEVSKLVYTKEL